MRKMTGRSLSDLQLITKSISHPVTLRLKPGKFKIPKREHTQMSDLQRSDRQKPSTGMTLRHVVCRGLHKWTSTEAESVNLK